MCHEELADVLIEEAQSLERSTCPHKTKDDLGHEYDCPDFYHLTRATRGASFKHIYKFFKRAQEEIHQGNGLFGMRFLQRCSLQLTLPA